MKAVLILFVVGLFLLAGCKDITDSYKPGSFGASAQDNKIVDYYTAKYGDLTASGTPRILEPLISSNVKDYIPSNKVTQFSKDTTNLYAWFVYDNFKENDEINVEWKYLDTNYVIYIFKSSAGGDFGRGVFILERPDTGWPLGKYEVTISGMGTTSKINFEIINGTTVTVPLPFDAGAATNANTAVATDTKSVSGFEIKNTACSFAGKWSTNWGDMELSSTGNKLTGTYTHDAGKITGTVNKNVAVGKWSESPSYAEPSDAGDMEFQLSDDCKSFSGNWRYGSAGDWSGGWTGTSVSASTSADTSTEDYYQVDFSNGNHKRMIKGALVDKSFMIAGSANNAEAPLVWLAQGNTPGGDGYPASFSWNVPDQEAKTLAFASVIAWNPLSSTWMGKKIGMITVEGSNGEKKTFDLIYGTHTQGWNEPAGNINNPPTTEVITNLPSIYEDKAFINKFDLGSMNVRKITAEVTNIGTYDGTRSSVLIIYGMTLLQ